MNQLNSPLPPPDGVTCPNCGTAQSSSLAYCARCGMPLPSQKSSVIPVILKFIVVLTLSLGALGFGVLGACAGLAELAQIPGADAGAGAIFLGIAVVLAIAAQGLTVFWRVKKLKWPK